jgi:hypothetical protein
LAQAVEGEVGAHGRPAGVDVEGAGMEDLHGGGVTLWIITSHIGQHI